MGPLENEDMLSGQWLADEVRGSSSGSTGGSSSDVVTTGKQGGNGQAWFGLGINAFDSVSSFILSILGKNNNTNYNNQDYYLQQQQNNRTLLIVGAVFIVVLILVVVLATRK